MVSLIVYGFFKNNSNNTVLAFHASAEPIEPRSLVRKLELHKHKKKILQTLCCRQNNIVFPSFFFFY